MFRGRGTTSSVIQAAGSPGAGVNAAPNALVVLVITKAPTLSRAAVTGLPHADETGGLSGKPVFDASNEVIRKLRAEVGDTVPIIGVGGIFSGEDARAKLAAGAALVQLYTGFIYRGPALVAECAQALA